MQVWNLEDTISINHNWFNGTNVGQVLALLTAELRKVEREISDCRDDEDWPMLCQSLLRASFGMSHVDMLSLLKLVLDRRLRMMGEEEEEEEGAPLSLCPLTRPGWDGSIACTI